jgi:integrase
MRWSELDIPGGTWSIPSARTKNGKEHIVHLSPQATAELSALEKQNSEFVFTGTGKTPISGFSKAKRELDNALPIEAWRVHDLRRTAASGMARLGSEPHVIERVLNHVSGATGGLVGVYQRYEYLEERKAALEKWGEYIAQLAIHPNNA